MADPLIEEIALMLPSPMGSDTPIALAERIIAKVRGYDRAQVLSTIDEMISEETNRRVHRVMRAG